MAEVTSNLRIILQYLPTHTNHTALRIVWSRTSNFAVFESFSLFFYQIFSSQIISKTRKTCRRTKKICFRCCKKVPKRLVLPDWAKWEQSRDLCALSEGKGGCRTFRRDCTYIYVQRKWFVGETLPNTVEYLSHPVS